MGELAATRRQMCHVCIELNRVMYRSTYFQGLIREDKDRRGRMGL